jgi:hypothetical protein
MPHYSERRDAIFATTTGGFILSFAQNGRAVQEYVDRIDMYQASHGKPPDANPVYRIKRPKKRQRD